jgi:hypothetical protein
MGRPGDLDLSRRVVRELDPMFLAGRLEYDVMTYWCAPGQISLPGQPFTLD